MAGTQLEIFKDRAMPAHIAAINEEHRNIVPRASSNSLTFEGKTFAITLDGKKTKLMRKDPDSGEDAPVQVFNCVLLGYNPFRGRMYYEGKYDPKKPKIPDCWSDQGQTPNKDVPKPMAKTCAECKMSKKGSAVTDDNKQTTACSAFQKLAIVPLANLGEFPVLRLSIKITSIWDADGETKHPNWFAFDQYIQALTSNGVFNTSVLPTKIKFDVDSGFPKLLFSTGKQFFDAEQAVLTNRMAQSEEVKAILAETFHPGQTTGTAELPEDEADTAGPDKPAPATAAQVGPKGKATPAPKDPDDDDGMGAVVAATKGPVTLDNDTGAEVTMTADQQAAAQRAKVADDTSKAAARAAAKAAQQAAARPVIADEDEEEKELERQLAAKKAAREAAKAAAEAGDGDPPAKPKVTAPPKDKAKAAVATEPVKAPANVASLMEDWDA